MVLGSKGGQFRPPLLQMVFSCEGLAVHVTSGSKIPTSASSEKREFSDVFWMNFRGFFGKNDEKNFPIYAKIINSFFLA